MIYLTGVLTEGISVGRPGMKLLLGTCLVSGSHLNLWPSPVPPLPPRSMLPASFAPASPSPTQLPNRLHL